jgi:hypothetical protein
VREGGLSWKLKGREPETKDPKPNLSALEARMLHGVCVELLELSCHVAGKIEAAPAWLAAHAQEEGMITNPDVRS